MLLLNNEKQGTLQITLHFAGFLLHEPIYIPPLGAENLKRTLKKHALSTHAMHARVAIRTESI